MKKKDRRGREVYYATLENWPPAKRKEDWFSIINLFLLLIFFFIFWDYLFIVCDWFSKLSWWIKGPVIYILVIVGLTAFYNKWSNSKKHGNFI